MPSEISFAVAVTIRMPLSLISSRRASSCRHFVSFPVGVSKRNSLTGNSALYFYSNQLYCSMRDIDSEVCKKYADAALSAFGSDKAGSRTKS